MRTRWWLVSLIALCLMLTLSGCTGMFNRKPPGIQTGAVAGQVVDTEGLPVMGVKVHVNGVEPVFTDADGKYYLPKVPAGRQVVSFEYFVPSDEIQHQAIAGTFTAQSFDAPPLINPPDLPIAWDALFASPVSPSATVENNQRQIEVVAAKTTTIQPIVVPRFQDVDALHLYHATPSIGEAVAARTSVNVEFDLHYSLTRPNGFVVLQLLTETSTPGQLRPFLQLHQHVHRGSGSVRFSDVITVPATTRLYVLGAVLSAEQDTLTVSSWDSYPVRGGVIPHAPEVKIIGFDDQRIIVGWSGGNPLHFKAYHLYRSTSQMWLRPYLTTEDPDAFLMMDTDFYEDTTYYYQLYLETEAGKLYESNVDYIYIPRPGVHELSLRAGSQIGDIVVDPMRDRLYVSDTQHNAVWVISTLGDSQGGALIDRIPVGARPGGLALSSDRLYVANSGNHTVTDLDTATYVASFIQGIREPGGIAVDPALGRLYVTSTLPGEQQIVVLDLDTHAPIDAAPLQASRPDRIHVSANGEYLLIGSTDGSGPAYVLDAHTLDEIDQIGETSLRFFSVGQDEGHLYIGNTILDGHSLTVIDELPHLILASGSHGDRLYTLGSSDVESRASANDRYMYVLARQADGGWLPELRIDLGEPISGKVAISRDEDWAYIVTKSHKLLTIDLDLRRSVRSGEGLEGSL